MSLWVKLQTSFWTHRKTLRLKARIGSDAFWVLPRLWSYCATNQPDGDLSGYTSEELAVLVGYDKDASSNASSILQAMLDCGFIDADENGKPCKVHGWEEHNGYHESYSKRAKNAASKRWQQVEEKEERSEMNRDDLSIASSNATSIDERVKSLNLIFRRRDTTVWSQKETKAYRQCASVCHQSDFEALIEFYTKSGDKFLRRDLQTLLNNWNGEVDRAKAWKANPHKDKPLARNSIEEQFLNRPL